MSSKAVLTKSVFLSFCGASLLSAALFKFRNSGRAVPDMLNTRTFARLPKVRLLLSRLILSPGVHHSRDALASTLGNQTYAGTASAQRAWGHWRNQEFHWA